MSDDQMTELLKRAAETYTPNDNGELLAAVKSRGRRRARIHKFEVGITALAPRGSGLRNPGLDFGGWPTRRITVRSLPQHLVALPTRRGLFPNDWRLNGQRDRGSVLCECQARYRLAQRLRPLDDHGHIVRLWPSSGATMAGQHGGLSVSTCESPTRIVEPPIPSSISQPTARTGGSTGMRRSSPTTGGPPLTRDSLAGLVSNLSIVGGNVWAWFGPVRPVTPPAVRVFYPAPAQGGSWDIVTSAPALTYRICLCCDPRSIVPTWLHRQMQGCCIQPTMEDPRGTTIHCLHCVESSYA